MSTAGPEYTQTLTGELFGRSSKRCVFAALAWVLAFVGQAFAVALVVGQKGEPPTRGLPREQAEGAPGALRSAAPVCRAPIDGLARDGANQTAADDSRWAEQADDFVDYAESRLVRMTKLVSNRAACSLTLPLAR